MHTFKFNGIYVIFGITPKHNLVRTSFFVISTSNLVRYCIWLWFFSNFI